jgi:hypothetical protein
LIEVKRRSRSPASTSKNGPNADFDPTLQLETKLIDPEGSPAIDVGWRKVVPCVCIVDGKRHIRKFLEAALEELGFATCE